MTRTHLHSRSIEINGYGRTDGLYEVEARLIDTKPFNFRPRSDTRVVQTGDSIHDFLVRIVFDEELVVNDIVAEPSAVPYADCLGGSETLKQLIGLKMSSGWASECKKRLAGEKGCSHLTGLMVPLATVAFQTLAGLRVEKPMPLHPDGRPVLLNSCLAYSQSGKIVRDQWSKFYKD